MTRGTRHSTGGATGAGVGAVVGAGVPVGARDGARVGACVDGHVHVYAGVGISGGKQNEQNTGHGAQAPGGLCN